MVLVADAVGRAVTRRVIEQMRADPRTLEGVVDAARAKSALVAALPRDEVRRHVAPLLTAVSSAFIDSAELSAADIEVAHQLAVDRAIQGIPLTALLEGFQAGRQYALRQLAGRATAEHLPADRVMDVVIELDAYANEMQNRLIQSYHETELNLTHAAQAARLEALRILLHDGPASCIADTGLDPARDYHCVITRISDPRHARRMEATLSAIGGLTGMVDGYLCAVTARLPAGTALAGILVIASPAVRPDRLPEVYELCRMARDSAARRGLRGLRPLTRLATAIVSDCHPRLAELLADELVTGLDPADEFHRLLAETALVYFAHGSRADLTAATLHVHPNTVKHRMRRLDELTGVGAPSSPGDILHHTLRWSWALHSWLTRSKPVDRAASAM